MVNANSINSFCSTKYSGWVGYVFMAKEHLFWVMWTPKIQSFYEGEEIDFYYDSNENVIPRLASRKTRYVVGL